MELIKNIIRDRTIYSIVLLLLGLILFIFPIESISIASKTIAGILIVAGLANIIYFFIDNKYKSRMDTIYFILSLLVISGGIYTFINPIWLITTINILVGIVLIVCSIINLRYLFKYTYHNNLWFVLVITSGIVLLFGIFAIINPTEVVSIITRIEGLSLIFDASMSLLLIKKLSK